ncbi:rhodanese-like domain-containing protein [Vagococcus acidifermentans]|uniref:Sulfurtransferase n=1 Tax=Vagococcus acidifermentans TaxID=564710 RepID=A0A430AN46_9ENTE|nr:rhodanese-like domain-containing protein [Vagococcus acidifermentans]RSU09542.1 sulfurtransferase [Vagococcus acidifermentans]
MSFLRTLNIFLLTIIALFGLYELYFIIKRKLSGAEWIEQDEFIEGMRKAQVIDVREKDSYNAGHILGARSIPYTLARSHKEYLTSLRKDQPIYLYEDRKKLAISVASMLKKEGYTDVYILKKGFSEWSGKTKKKATY